MKKQSLENEIEQKPMWIKHVQDTTTVVVHEFKG